MAFVRFMMIAAGLTLIGGGVGAVALAPQWEPYLRKEMARSLGEVLGTTVEIGKVRPAWLEGALALENVVVQNPPGYKEPTAAVCDRVLIQPEFLTVFSKSPVIACVSLEGTALKLRYKPGESTNLGYFKQQAATAAQPAAAGTAGAEAPGGVVVKQVRAENTKVDLVPGPMINLDLKPGAGMPSMGTVSIPVSEAASAATTVLGVVDALIKQASAMQGLVQPLTDLLKTETAAPAPTAAAPGAAPAVSAPPVSAPPVTLDIPEI